MKFDHKSPYRMAVHFTHRMDGGTDFQFSFGDLKRETAIKMMEDREVWDFLVAKAREYKDEENGHNGVHLQVPAR